MRSAAWLVALAVWIGGVGAADAAKPATVVPTCDLLPGQTKLQTAKWRIFRPPGREAFKRLWYACERGVGPVERVIHLRYRDHFMQPTEIDGDVVLLQLFASDGKYNPSEQRFEAIDLGRAARAVIGPSTYSEAVQPTAHLAGNGGVVWWTSPGIWAEARDVVLEDATGRTTLSVGPSDFAWTPITLSGNDGDAVGGYVYDTGKRPTAVHATGSAQLSWTPAPDLTPKRNRVRVAKRPRFTRRTLAMTYNDGPVDLIERRRGKRRTAEISAFGVRLAQVVPGTAVSVLASSGGKYGKHSVSGGYLLLDATFVDSGTRSVRLLSVDYFWAGKGRTKLRMVRAFAAPAVPPASGTVAVSVGGAVAMADGDVLRIWDPEPRELPMAGVRDVVVMDQLGHTTDTPTLLATDRAGTIHSVPLGERTLE